MLFLTVNTHPEVDLLFALDFLHSATLGFIVRLQCSQLLKFMPSFLCLQSSMSVKCFYIVNL